MQGTKNISKIIQIAALIILGLSFQIVPLQKELNGKGSWTNGADGLPIFTYVPAKCSDKVTKDLASLYEDTIKIWAEVGKEVGDVLCYEKVVKAFGHQGLKDMSDPFQKNFTFTSFNGISGLASDLSTILTPKKSDYKQDFHPVFAKWLDNALVVRLDSDKVQFGSLVSLIFKPARGEYKSFFCYYEFSYQKKTGTGELTLDIKVASFEKGK